MKNNSVYNLRHWTNLGFLTDMQYLIGMSTLMSAYLTDALIPFVFSILGIDWYWVVL